MIIRRRLDKSRLSSSPAWSIAATCAGAMNAWVGRDFSNSSASDGGVNAGTQITVAPHMSARVAA